MKQVYFVVKVTRESGDGLEPDGEGGLSFRGSHCWSEKSEKIHSIHDRKWRAEAAMSKLSPESILTPANPGRGDGLIEYEKTVRYEIRKFRVGGNLNLRKEDEDEDYG